MKNKITLLLSVSMSIFLLSFVSSTGLIASNLNYTSTKYQGINTSYSLTLTNSEIFPMYNISIENNNYLYFPIISELSPGASININGTIFANTSFNQNFSIKGIYYTNIGNSNNTYNVSVDFYNGESICNFATTIGDKVNFINNVNDDITLRNVLTNENVVTILKNDSYLFNIISSGSFKYYFLRLGYPFGDTCTITMLPTTGYVNNPNYDANILMNVNVLYSPTILEYTFLENNYTIEAMTKTDGVFSIKNIGNNTAKNITLSSDWFTFSSNNFDLSPSLSKAISYTITPAILNTNQTNQSYTKQLKIEGNFNTTTKDFNIFIPYKNLTNYNDLSNYDSLISTLSEICNLYPNKYSWCDNTSKVIIYNSSNDTFNMTFSAEQVKGIFETVFSMKDSLDVNNNYYKEQLELLESKLNETASANNVSYQVKSQLQQNNDLSIAVLLIISLVLIAGTITVFIFYKKKEDKLKDVTRW